jgi:radical SAM protein with 4Fe4S-binding SPASM domain
MPRGRLRLDVAKRILDRFPALVRLNLSLWGEPLLNPDIFAIIRYARDRDIEVLLQSNLSLPRFDRTMAQRLLDSDLSLLQLSIDGATQAAYQVYRRRGDLATVLRNIELIRDLQEAQGRKHPRIIWKMIVHRYNEHEVHAAKARADRLGVDFLTVEIYAPDHLKPEWKPALDFQGTGLATHTDGVDRCYTLWQVMTVNFNGDVFPCCSEWSPLDSLGNVLRQDVREIWNGPAYRWLRARNRTAPRACNECHQDRETRYWRNWHPQGEEDRNEAMLPNAARFTPRAERARSAGPPAKESADTVRAGGTPGSPPSASRGA